QILEREAVVEALHVEREVAQVELSALPHRDRGGRVVGQRHGVLGTGRGQERHGEQRGRDVRGTGTIGASHVVSTEGVDQRTGLTPTSMVESSSPTTKRAW